jgi:hypothetical protein
MKQTHKYEAAQRPGAGICALLESEDFHVVLLTVCEFREGRTATASGRVAVRCCGTVCTVWCAPFGVRRLVCTRTEPLLVVRLAFLCYVNKLVTSLCVCASSIVTSEPSD